MICVQSVINERGLASSGEVWKLMCALVFQKGVPEAHTLAWGTLIKVTTQQAGSRDPVRGIFTLN